MRRLSTLQFRASGSACLQGFNVYEYDDMWMEPLQALQPRA